MPSISGKASIIRQATPNAAVLNPAATVGPFDMMIFHRSKRDLRHEATHSRIRVADRSCGCTQTAIRRAFRHRAAGKRTAHRPHLAGTLPALRSQLARTRTAAGLQQDSSRNIERPAQASENAHCDAIHAHTAAESFQGRSRTAKPMRITTWPRRSAHWPYVSCRMSGTFDHALRSESSIPDAIACRSSQPIACRRNLDRTEYFAG